MILNGTTYDSPTRRPIMRWFIPPTGWRTESTGGLHRDTRLMILVALALKYLLD
jgi:hypothetical protein